MAKFTKWCAGGCSRSSSVSMAWCKGSVKAIPILSPAAGSLNWRIELRPLHDIAPAVSSANRLHSELKEGTTGGATSHLLPPVKRSVQKGVLSVFFITKVHPEYIVRHGRGDNLNFPRKTMALETEKHLMSQELGFVEGTQVMVRWGVWSTVGRSGVDPPMGTDSSTRAKPGPSTMIGGRDDRYR